MLDAAATMSYKLTFTSDDGTRHSTHLVLLVQLWHRKQQNISCKCRQPHMST